MRKIFNDDKLTRAAIWNIIREGKPNQAERISLKAERIKEYAFADFCVKMKKTISLRNVCAHPDVKGPEVATEDKRMVYSRENEWKGSNSNVVLKRIYELILMHPSLLK